MQIIHFTDKAIGSLDWELPEDISAAMSIMPEDVRKVMLKDIENLIKGNVFMLIGALKLGYGTGETLDLIRAKQLELIQDLKVLASRG